jgi:cell division protein FtsI/penicillin-binding protein 2
VVKAIVAPDGRVLQETKPQVAAKLSARPQNIELVRQSMLGAIESPSGTGHRADVKGVSVAGKTGTAEFDSHEGRINRAWFIGFAPYEAPTVAVAVCVEDGDSGGHTAAPVGGQIFAKVFGKEVAGGGGGGD